MFDWVRVEVALPDGSSTEGPFQTKDLDCCMDTLRITATGRLLRERDIWEATPEYELPYPDKPFIGSLRSIGTQTDDTEHHGYLNFYDYDSKTKLSREYRAKFTDGNLVEIVKVER